ELGVVLDTVLGKGTVPARQASMLAALEQATRQRGVRPAGDLTRVLPLLAAENEAVRIAAIRDAGLWQVEKARPTLLKYAGEKNSSDPVRRAAVEGLASLGGKESLAALDDFTDPKYPISLRRQALVALTGLDTAAAASRAVAVLTGEQDSADTVAIFTAFLQRKDGAALLTKALAETKLPPDVAKVGLRTVRASGR